MLVNWDMSDEQVIDWIEDMLEQLDSCCLDDEQDRMTVTFKLAANFVHALKVRSAHPSDPVGEAV